jgi:hypothetical protein
MRKKHRTSNIERRTSKWDMAQKGASECDLREVWAKRVNGIADADEAGLDDFGEDALALVFHQIAQADADGVHFGAGGARFVEVEDRAANGDAPAEESEQVYAESFDVGADGAGRNDLKAKGDGVFGNFLAGDEGDLAAVGFVRAARPAKVAGVADDAFARDEFDGFGRKERRAGLGRVQMQGGNTTGRSIGRRVVHAAKIMTQELAGRKRKGKLSAAIATVLPAPFEDGIEQ